MKTFVIGIVSVFFAAGVAFAQDAQPGPKQAEAGCEGCEGGGCEDEAAAPAKAKAEGDDCGDCGGCGSAAASNPAFERLKTLEGEWVGSMPSPEGSDAPAQEIHVSYKVTSGGSALVETLFEGTPKEMITVYHLDGDAITLTHFCFGNQPRMKLAKSEGDSLHFEYVGGTNCDPEQGFMGRLVLTMEGSTLRQSWSVLKGEEVVQTVDFELTRGRTSK